MNRDPFDVTWEQVYREAWTGFVLLFALYVWMLMAGVIGLPFGALG